MQFSGYLAMADRSRHVVTSELTVHGPARFKGVPWYDISGDVADPTGTTDSRAAFVTADESTNGFVPPGTFRVASNLTLSSVWRFAPGAAIRPDNGVTVTITGSIEAGLWRIFDQSAGGTVTFGAGAKVPVVWAQWWGLVADGTTDDKAVLEAALKAASVIKAETRAGLATIGLSSLTLPAHVDYHGMGGVWRKVGSSIANFVAVSATTTHTALRHLTVDANSLVTTNLVNVLANAAGVTLEDVRLVDPARSVDAVRVRTTSQFRMRRSVIDGCSHGLRFDELPVDVLIEDTHIKNWTTRGIFVVGASPDHVEDFTIRGCRITDMVAGGSVRQPIAIQGDDEFPHRNVRVLDTTVLGPNKSYSHPTDPGTADQISLHRCVGFEISGCISHYGGDMGITVSQQCSDGKVVGNTCMFNDVAGIDFGSNGTLYARGMTAEGNVCTSNGQNRNGDREPKGRVGIRVQGGAEAITINGNVLGDFQAVPTQQYGISCSDTTNVTIGYNTYPGNAIGPFFDHVGNTGLQGPIVQGSAIADASGGVTVDTEARAALNALLTLLRSRGDIAT